MTDSLSYAQRNAWSRNLRNAATLARLQVLSCLQKHQCYEEVGTGAGGDATKEFDRVAEQTIINFLQKFASFTVISEEVGIQQIGKNPQGYVIMDPIDGSTNLSHQIPIACISIAFGSKPLFDLIEAAVVMELFEGKCYHALRHGGAFLDFERIQPKKANGARKNLVGVDSEFPPSYSMLKDQLGEGKTIRYTRHLGANALELCYVADGTLDGFVDLRGVFRGTDLAAASLILDEAGAVLINLQGEPVAGDCSNETYYSLIGARDLQFGQRLLRLALGEKKE